MWVCTMRCYNGGPFSTHGTFNMKYPPPPHARQQPCSIAVHVCRRQIRATAMLLLFSLASSAALIAPGPSSWGVSSTTARPSPPLMNQATGACRRGPAGEDRACRRGRQRGLSKRSVVKRWLASRCLSFAVVNDNIGLGKRLIKAGANLETLIRDCTPLQIAVIRGNEGWVEALVEGGALLEAVGPTGARPLQLAVSTGNVGVLKVLVKAGASLEGVADGQMPDLMLAIRNAIRMGGNLELVKALIEAGVSLEADASGATVLQFAIITGRESLDTIKADIKTNASLEAEFRVYASSEKTAMPNGNLDAIKMLVEAGSSLKAPAGGLNYTALELAMCFGNVDVIKALVQARGSIEAVEGGSHLTALEFAIGIKNSVVVEALISAGASLDGPGGNKPTLLQCALRKR